MPPENNPSWVVTVYGVYLAASIALTIWVAQTLHRNGRLFLIDAFHGNGPLADSVNHLLVVGFYLINVGFVALALKTSTEAGGVREAIELLSLKLGRVLLVLGFMHFTNLVFFSRFRRHTLNEAAARVAPPVL